MSTLLLQYKQNLARLVRDCPHGEQSQEEDRLTEVLDDLWYRLSPEERATADDFSRRLAKDEISAEDFYREAFAGQFHEQLKIYIDFAIPRMLVSETSFVKPKIAKTIIRGQCFRHAMPNFGAVKFAGGGPVAYISDAAMDELKQYVNETALPKDDVRQQRDCFFGTFGAQVA